MRILLIFVLLSASNNSLSCNCKKIKNLERAQLEAYQNNELIFIAEVIESQQGKVIG